MGTLVNLSTGGQRAVGIQRVYIKQTWAGGWLPLPEAHCTEAAWCVSPTMPTATLVYDYGGVKNFGSPVYVRQVKLDTALSDYSASKRISPDSGPTWLNEGAAFILKQDYNSALVSLDRAIALDSIDLYAAYYNRALARERTGDVEGAYYDFVKSKELNPDYAPTDDQLARFTVKTN
jgi:tetratricopeptide (TPR) repeat protein